MVDGGRVRSATRGAEPCTGSDESPGSRERERELAGEPVLVFFSTEEDMGDLLSGFLGDFVFKEDEVPSFGPCTALEARAGRVGAPARSFP